MRHYKGQYPALVESGVSMPGMVLTLIRNPHAGYLSSITLDLDSIKISLVLSGFA